MLDPVFLATLLMYAKLVSEMERESKRTENAAIAAVVTMILIHQHCKKSKNKRVTDEYADGWKHARIVHEKWLTMFQ
jgi:hypothetical protein